MDGHAIGVSPHQIAEALGIDLWTLAIQQGNWAASDLVQTANLMDLERTGCIRDLDEFDRRIAGARRMYEGALVTLEAAEREPEE